MAGLWHRLHAWWNRDALEQASEATRGTQAARDAAQEDYEGRKDDEYVSRDLLAGASADYERDSEPPRDETP